MFNLYQIITGAQGGQALDNLASQFGITREQADATVQALVPALSTAFMTKAAQPGGMQEIAGVLDDDDHKQAYADPGTAQAPATQQKGDEVASSIFGDSSIIDQVVNHASTYTGVPAETIKEMLPVIIALVVGGVAIALHNQGLGNIIGQLSSGLGGFFGQANAAPGQAGTGGFGGMFGNILGGLFGGGQAAAPPQPEPTPAEPTPPEPAPAQPAPQPVPPVQPAQAPEPEAGFPPAVQAGLDALTKMFQPGVAPHAGQPADLSAQISSILGGKRD